MALITIWHAESVALDVECEVLVNPETKQAYAIAHFVERGIYVPMSAEMTAHGPEGLHPIPVAGQPGMVHACATSDEARMVLEVHDGLSV